MVAGADCIDDADVLRAGATGAVLPHKVMAPSTLGTFLRCFDFGHIRQLDQLAEAMLTRAWSAGAGPGAGPMTVDVDSTICPVHGDEKQGAAFGYTHVLGYHPLLATRADTGEVLHVRFRKGSAGSGRGAERFVRELVGRSPARRAAGPLTLRADSGFYSRHVVKACRDHDVRYSITAPQNPGVQRAIVGIDEESWIPIDYTEGGEAWVAETTYGDGHRLVVRRTRLADPQPALPRFPLPRLHHRPGRQRGRPRRRPPTPRGDRARDPGPQRGVGARALPLGALRRQRCLGRALDDRPQPAPLGRGPRSSDPRADRREDGPAPVPSRYPAGSPIAARHRQLHLPANWPWAEQWTACFTRLYALRA